MIILPSLSFAQRDFMRLVNLWKRRLGLDNWRIVVLFEECEDKSAYMEVFRLSDYQRAKIIVPPWMISEGPIPDEVTIKPDEISEHFLQESLVHEMLHIVVTPMRVIMHEDLDTFLHRDVWTQIDNSFRHAEERVVDNLAVSLVRSYYEL